VATDPLALADSATAWSGQSGPVLAITLFAALLQAVWNGIAHGFAR
jgi:hypothetical protein